MIEIGPNIECASQSIAPDRLPVATILKRVAQELNYLSTLLRELEDGLLITQGDNLSTDRIIAQQSIDTILQSVEALKHFIVNVERQCGPLDVEVSGALGQVPLGEMRARLSIGTDSVIPP